MPSEENQISNRPVARNDEEDHLLPLYLNDRLRVVHSLNRQYSYANVPPVKTPLPAPLVMECRAHEAAIRGPSHGTHKGENPNTGTHGVDGSTSESRMPAEVSWVCLGKNSIPSHVFTLAPDTPFKLNTNVIAPYNVNNFYSSELINLQLDRRDQELGKSIHNATSLSDPTAIQGHDVSSSLDNQSVKLNSDNGSSVAVGQCPDTSLSKDACGQANKEKGKGKAPMRMENSTCSHSCLKVLRNAIETRFSLSSFASFGSDPSSPSSSASSSTASSAIFSVSSESSGSTPPTSLSSVSASTSTSGSHLSSTTSSIYSTAPHNPAAGKRHFYLNIRNPTVEFSVPSACQNTKGVAVTDILAFGGQCVANADKPASRKFTSWHLEDLFIDLVVEWKGFSKEVYRVCVQCQCGSTITRGQLALEIARAHVKYFETQICSESYRKSPDIVKSIKDLRLMSLHTPDNGVTWRAQHAIVSTIFYDSKVTYRASPRRKKKAGAIYWGQGNQKRHIGYVRVK